MLRISEGAFAINRDEMRDILYRARGATPVTFIAVTKPELKGGKGCPLYGLIKIAKVNGLTNFHYERSVNRQRTREGEESDFKAQARSWGVKLFTENGRMLPLTCNLKDVEPNVTEDDVRQIPPSNLYMEVKVENTLGHKYILNGNDVPDSEVNQYLRGGSSSRQGLDKPVVIRQYALNTIQELAMNGKKFVVGSDLTVPQLFEKGGLIAV